MPTFCQDLITDGIILLDDFHAEAPPHSCVKGRKDILVSLFWGYTVFMILFATPGPCGYLNKIALLTPWKINGQIPVSVYVLSGFPHLTR